MIASHTSRQFLRYALVGLASNLLLYVAYLALSTAGMEPKRAMTLLYVVGVAQTFLFNKRWSFRHQEAGRLAFVRYCVVYGLGYALNLVVLILLVDHLGYPHEIVQGLMVLTLAVLLFLLQKFWVFRPGSTTQMVTTPTS